MMVNPLVYAWQNTRALDRYLAYKIDLAIAGIPLLGSLAELDLDEDSPVTLEGFLNQIQMEDLEKKKDNEERRAQQAKERERDSYYKRV